MWAVLVTFQVDMSQMVISSNGVHLAGSFQGWDPSTYPMTNIGGGIYAMTLNLPPGNYEFKFINGNAWGLDESVPAVCGMPNVFSVYNRSVDITSDIILPAFCFGQCGPCGQTNYVMNGSAASMGGDCYRVTAASQWQNGAFWSNTQIDLSTDFNLQFEINLGWNDADGADGLVFVLQRLGSNILGASGGGMGYSSFGQSLGIEFDTFENPEYNDPAYDHLAIELDGDINHYSPNNIAWPVQMSASNSNVEDGVNHTVSIDWKSGTQTMSVFFDCEFRLQATYDLVNHVFAGEPLVFWGFTGATGNLVNAQMVCATPVAMLTPSYEICPGSNVMINAGPSINQVYNWSPVTFLNDPALVNPIASPDSTIDYQVTYLDLCNVLVTKNIRVNVAESGAGCFFLPLTLLDFVVSADNDNVKIDWRVSDEAGVAGYIIESASSDLVFSAETFVQVSGNGEFFNQYSSQIQRMIAGRYYRLRKVDAFGYSEVISQIVFVQGHLGNPCHAYYNAAAHDIRMNCKLLSEKMMVCVFLPDGRLFRRELLGPGAEEAAIHTEGIVATFAALCVFNETGELLYRTKLMIAD